MIRERCSCGAEIETDEDNALEIWAAWRDVHDCPDTTTDHPPIGGTSQADLAPDYTLPEMHIGFR